MPKFGLVGAKVASAPTEELALSALGLTAATLNAETIGLTQADIWYVNSAVAGSTGISRATAVATIAAAITLAAAGDIIMVADGHTESLSDVLLCDASKAGLRIIGEGTGPQRPTITISHANGTLTISAAGVLLRNFLFLLTADATIVVDVNAADAWIDQCEFRARTAATAREYVTAIDINGGSANAADRAKVTNCLFTSTANAGSTQAIELGEVEADVLIAGNIIDGDWSNAGIHNPTGKVMTNLRIIGNSVRNRQTADHAIEIVSACTGSCEDNNLFGDTLGTILDPGSLFCAGNRETNVIDSPGVETPINHTFNPVLGYMVTKVHDLATVGATDDLFTVTGRVMITSLTGEVTTVVGGAATVKLRDTTNSVDLCAATTIDTDAVGTMYALTTISAAILNGAAMTPIIGSVPNLTGSSHAFVRVVGFAQSALAIGGVLDAADTGAITWTLTYVPITAGAIVVAAA